MTHAELVKLGAAWLKRQGYTIILEEFVCVCSHETPDLLAFKGRGWSCMIEVKTSRADFLKDRKKRARRHRCYSVGQDRLYLTPLGLIGAEEVPEEFGLLGVSGPRNRVTVVKPVDTRYRVGDVTVAANEAPFLIAACRRASLQGFDVNERFYAAKEKQLAYRQGKLNL